MSKPRTGSTSVAYLSMLRLLARGPLSVADAAKADNRVPSNIRRDLSKLIDAQLLRADGDLMSLTATGLQWLYGQDIAEGLQPLPEGPSATPTRWPLDAIQPNPLNRKVTMEGIADLADSIIGAGDILQPLILTPPDANGVRTILAGERRWTAVKLIHDRTATAGQGSYAEMAEMPAALIEGLPFVERDADEADALVITLIENSQRRDLTPLEDALQLHKLAEATGWNATELARKIGRTGRERDVQVKLKIAREATPEAIAEYEENGSWDRLRDSVTKPKAEPERPVARAEALLGGYHPSPAGTTRALLTATMSSDATALLEPAGAPAEDTEMGVQLTYAATLAFRELVHKMSVQSVAEGEMRTAPVGQYWLCPQATELQRTGLVSFRPQPGQAPYALLTDKGVDAVVALLDLWNETFDQMDWVEAVNILREDGTFDGTNYSTPWLAEIPVAAAYPAPSTEALIEQLDVEDFAPIAVADASLAAIWATPEVAVEVGELGRPVIVAVATGTQLLRVDPQYRLNDQQRLIVADAVAAALNAALGVGNAAPHQEQAA